jgi:general secretion pathway protein J
MTSLPRVGPSPRAGFTLIETLAAMALMGLILSALATITAQWLPNWNRGFARIQRSESVSIALERMSSDIGASEFIRASADAKSVLFDGNELDVTFVRSAIGPNARPGLEVVRLAETVDSDGFVLTRTHAAFVPGMISALNFADPVVLLRAPYRVSFSYAGPDRNWKDTWRDAQGLPAAVLMTVRDAATQQATAVSRIAAIHITAPADSLCANLEGGCNSKDALPDTAANNDAAPAAAAKPGG